MSQDLENCRAFHIHRQQYKLMHLLGHIYFVRLMVGKLENKLVHYQLLVLHSVLHSLEVLHTNLCLYLLLYMVFQPYH